MSDVENVKGKKLYYDPLSVSRRTAQSYYELTTEEKPALLYQLIKERGCSPCIVMVKTKKSATKLEAYLKSKAIPALGLHSNKSEQVCLQAVRAFNKKECDVLIATDMTFQKHQFKEVAYLISYNLPLEVQHYYQRLACMNEKGEGIALVSQEEYYIKEMLEWAMKIELSPLKLDGC